MNAKEFILKNYPVSAKDFENNECLGLDDIAFICEKYHESKVLLCDDCGGDEDVQTYCMNCMNERC